MIPYYIVLFVVLFFFIYTTIMYVRTKGWHLLPLIIIFLLFIFQTFPGYKHRGKLGPIEWEQESPANLFAFWNNQHKTKIKLKNVGDQPQEGILTIIADGPLKEISTSKPLISVRGGEGDKIALYKILANPGEVITASAVTSDTLTIMTGPTVKVNFSPWDNIFDGKDFKGLFDTDLKSN